MYQYSNLEGVSLREISECLNLAFSDYYVPIRLSEEELSGFFAVSGVDTKRSFGAFLDGNIVGFLLNSCNVYQGCKAVFDVGTGVVPEHRGKGVFSGLFAFALENMKADRIERYYLEVLQQNDRAIALYQRNGFAVTREFAVLQAGGSSELPSSERVRYAGFAEFDFQKASGCKRNDPSYEHSDHVLRQNPDCYEVAYLQEESISAFCVFSKSNGQILQLGWKAIPDLREVIGAVFTRYPHAAAKNIETSEREVLQMMDSLGFQTVARQFEMSRSLL